MKLRFLLPILFVFFLSVSCNSDDDTPETKQITADLILGKWQLQSIVKDGNTQELSECNLLDTNEYFDDCSYSDTSYRFENNTQGNDCIVSEDSFTGNWTNLENGMYTFADGEGNSFQNGVDFPNDTTLKITVVDEYTSNNGDLVTETFVFTYSKI